jgi:hypothetical protein
VSSVDALFEEFVSRWTREEPVDVDGLLERAGPGTDELAGLIDAFLERAPRRAPSDRAREAVAALAARLESEPPLLAARVAARQRVRDVAAAIVAACALPAEAEQLVRSYYQRLEGGLLDPEGVSERVWSVLEKLLGDAAHKLASAGFSPGAVVRGQPAVAFQRRASADFAAASAGPAPAGRELPPEVRREVEALFTGRRARH